MGIFERINYFYGIMGEINVRSVDGNINNQPNYYQLGAP
jgi:hypothetical protein